MQDASKSRVIYSPNMSKHIEDGVSQYPTCPWFRRSSRKEPMIAHPIDNAWERVATDIMTFKGRDYVLVVDYYSKYVYSKTKPHTRSPLLSSQLLQNPEFRKSSLQIICRLAARHSCKEIARQWGSGLITTSPLYPQADWLAERNFQTITTSCVRRTTTDVTHIWLS